MVYFLCFHICYPCFSVSDFMFSYSNPVFPLSSLCFLALVFIFTLGLILFLFLPPSFRLVTFIRRAGGRVINWEGPGVTDDSKAKNYFRKRRWIISSSCKSDGCFLNRCTNIQSFFRSKQLVRFLCLISLSHIPSGTQPEAWEAGSRERAFVFIINKFEITLLTKRRHENLKQKSKNVRVGILLQQPQFN